MRSLRHLMLLTTALVALSAAPAFAGPDGPAVVGGAAQVLNPGSANVTVNQFTDKAIVNWRLFDIGTNERVQFNQPAASSIILNRVTGGLGPSQILGSLDANGRVFIVNRDGILFGPNSQVNTAGFLATTHDIRNDDFMAGRFNFGTPGQPDASIVNLGTITATSGGFAALVAPGVRNSGTITATLGTVGLVSGNGFSLDFYGDKLVTLNVGDNIANSVRDVATGLPLRSLVTNDGKIKANGGRVELTAAAARQVVDAVINTSGVIEANTIGTHGGTIVLGAATAASKPPAAPAQTVKISGTLNAAGKKKGTTGGTIIATGENIVVSNATINASGREGGGKVLIGGDWGGGKPDTSLVTNPSARLESAAVPTASTVSVDAGTRIDASATQRGDGGKVIVWSDRTTSFAGTILALGGREIGNGGFAEVSSHGVLNYTGIADLRATNGKTGTLLLDPTDYYVEAVGGPAHPGSSVITNIDLQNQLGSASVVISTLSAGAQNGDIFVRAPVVWNAATTLTLSAFRNIEVSFVGVNGRAIQNIGAGSLILRADNTGISNGGTITLLGGTNFERVDWSGSTGTVSFYYNPTSYTAPANFTTGNGKVVTNTTPIVPNQFTAYMLVNTKANLQNISINLAGTYALGRDIDASGPAIAPLGNISPTQFTGILDGAKLDGSRYTISNLTVAPTTVGINNVGLFGFIGASGTVRNLIISGAQVIANPNIPPPGQFVGILAGSNNGAVTNVLVAGTVSNGAQQSGVIAGGLIGQNNSGGTVTQSTSAAAVNVGNSTSGSTSNSAGGLVGANVGTITDSSASGAITGGTNSFVGGLVGQNGVGLVGAGTINGLSFATGNVSGPSALGGLVGFNTAGSSITGANATGNVTATAANATAGGLVGQNEGTIASSIRNAGTISAGGFTSVLLGGLVGTNNSAGTVRDSSVSNLALSGNSITIGGLVGVNSGLITGTGAGQVFVSGVTLTVGTNTTAGALVGVNSTGGTIHNANANGTINALPATTLLTLGGLVGRNSGSVDNSTAATTVNGGPGTAGGLVGHNEGTITTSTASGNVTATGFSSTFAYLGGLIGFNSATAQITGSTATGTVRATSYAHAGGLIGDNSASLSNLSAGNPLIVSGINVAAGGLIGANNTGATITNSQASGAITSTATTSSSIGGLIGDNRGKILGTAEPGANQTCTAGQSCASGAITAVTASEAGGLVGSNSGTVTNSFATGAVTATEAASTAGFASFGGLIGTSTGAVDRSHATGAVTGTFAFNSGNYSSSSNNGFSGLALGGLIGTSTAAVTNSFATGNVSATFNASSGNTYYYGYGTALGGLIGQQSGATVSGSYATGTVTGTFNGGDYYSYAYSTFMGGLIGASSANVSDSHATGAVIANNNSAFAGGLIGYQSNGTVTNAFATGDVTANVTLNSSNGYYFGSFGGLVGTAYNTAITGSHATGNVTWNLPSNAYTYLFGAYGGGLVGSITLGSISNSYATGNVTAAAGNFYNVAGGLVGSAYGTPIDSSYATGNVTGSTSGGLDQTGYFSHGGVTGGLVGIAYPNYIVSINGNTVTLVPAAITNSYATGNVTGWGETGGLVGWNYGDIASSYATGKVTGLGHSFNQTFTYTYTDPTTGQPVTYSYTYKYIPSVGGLVGDHASGTISNSYATGAVTGRGFVGGLAGSSEGTITSSHATGAVTEAAANNDAFNSALGGLVGVNSGSIKNSQASGPVTGGDSAILGGFAAVNTGTISNSTSSGAVTGTSDSFLGGLVGLNTGLIQDSTSSSTVTGTGQHNVAGGLVGINFGFIDPSHSSGTVASGPNSIVGGFVGANAAVRFANGTEYIGTISSDSNGTGTATAGPGSTVGLQVGQAYPTAGLPGLPRASCDNGGGLCDATLFNPNPQQTQQPQQPQQPSNEPQQPNSAAISPLLTIVAQFIKEQDLTQPAELIVTVNNAAPGAPTGTRPTNPGNPGVPSWFGPNARLPSGLPPLTETRFLNNEVVFQLGNGTPEQVAAVARALGLQILAAEDFGLLGRRIYRFRLAAGQSVREIIPKLEAYKFAVQAQPLYVFDLAQTAPAPAANTGDSAQYIVAKLRLPEVHLLATGKDVLVAVVDSAIDVNHPDLAGVIAGKFDSAGAEEKPHPHGTGMAGAIASHKRLLGIAPNVRLLAIQAFGVNSGGAQGTSLAIVKGLNWAVDQGARIINMSFAGPKDPILEQAIKAMREKGIILIAAAGNAGPKSPPLFPGADPNVIAVSATDSDDKVYDKANRGKYVSIAAPGVDILVPAPDGGYQLTTGTSVAAAHVSGVAALLLERNPNLKPDELKKILTSTAIKLKAKPEDVGAGLVDPYDALVKIGPKTAKVQ